jgi:ABC-type lipoprotein export system ATPase subunit
MALLRVNSLSKSYPDREETSLVNKVLSKISFELEERQLCTIYGPSGAGKTTLLNMIAGLDRPDEGEVEFDGSKIHELDEPKLAKLRSSSIGIVYQNPNLITHLNVLENVMLPVLFREQDRDGLKERAISLISKLGLGGKLGKTPSKLSDGEKRRASIARGLVTEPKLLIADEPTINLDSENRDVVLNMIKSYTENEGHSAIIATHDVDVRKISDVVLNIKFGVLSQTEN